MKFKICKKLENLNEKITNLKLEFVVEAEDEREAVQIADDIIRRTYIVIENYYDEIYDYHLDFECENIMEE